VWKMLTVMCCAFLDYSHNLFWALRLLDSHSRLCPSLLTFAALVTLKLDFRLNLLLGNEICAQHFYIQFALFLKNFKIV
jgi:hypothetical protein